jgi:hypothetical protein
MFVRLAKTLLITCIVAACSGGTDTSNRNSDGNEVPTAEECMQFDTEKQCLDAGCWKFDQAFFGIIKNGECKVKTEEAKGICLIPEEYNGEPITIDSTERAYVRSVENSSSKQEVMKLGSGPDDLAGGWEKCNNVFPQKNECGCDF